MDIKHLNRNKHSTSWITNKTRNLIKIVLVIGMCFTFILFVYNSKSKVDSQYNVTPLIDTINVGPKFINKNAKEGLIDALEYYDVHHPEIVYAQAILETGHFKSIGCLERNNLFGLYDSRTNKYYRFNHWTESVIAYKEWVQRKYEPPENYYNFLNRIGYASDSMYVSKLRKIVKNQNDKGRYIKRDIRYKSE